MSDQKEFERTLITHNHLDLLDRIKRKHQLPFSAPHNSLLQLLGVFYKRDRYARFGLTECGNADGEKAELHQFFEKHLGVAITGDAPFGVSENSNRIKSFLSRIVGKIARSLYKVVREEAFRLNLYTYELRSYSKAARVFLFKDCDFVKEDVLWKELLLFMMRAEETTGQVAHLRSLEPLGFDPGLEVEYLHCFRSEEKKLRVLGELEALYEGLSDPGGRLKALEVVGNPNVFLDLKDFIGGKADS